jgi:P27 family predicted phage terminase small subunit
MGRRGPPKKPTALKILNGNAGKRKLNAEEPKPEVEIPECPDFLHPIAKEEWARITPALFRLGLISGLDVAALAAYCQLYARWRQAEEFIADEGSVFSVECVSEKGGVYYMTRPEVAISHRYYQLMAKYLGQFGLSPASRSSIVVTAKQDDDLLKKFMRKNSGA